MVLKYNFIKNCVMHIIKVITAFRFSYNILIDYKERNSLELSTLQ